MKIKYEKYSTETLLDNIPENIILYKDSGLWTFYNDSFNKIMLEQNIIESFKQFVVRFMYKLEKDGLIDWWNNLDIVLNESNKR